MRLRCLGRPSKATTSILLLEAGSLHRRQVAWWHVVFILLCCPPASATLQVAKSSPCELYSDLTKSFAAETGRDDDTIQTAIDCVGQKSGCYCESGTQSPPLICKWCVTADLRSRKRKLHHTSCICIGIQKSYKQFPITCNIR